MNVADNWLVLGAAVVLTLALYGWGRWVVRRHGRLSYRLAAHGILLGACAALGGALWALQRLSAARALPPEAPGAAAQYAQGVSQAFRVAALPIGLGNLVVLVSIVVLLVGTLRRPERRAPLDG